MDNASYVASAELAPGKARTAVFKNPSQALEDAIKHGRTAAITARGFIEVQGGLPIVVDGQFIGGIGASFDTPEHDVQIAQAGLAALTHEIKLSRMMSKPSPKTDRQDLSVAVAMILPGAATYAVCRVGLFGSRIGIRSAD